MSSRFAFLFAFVTLSLLSPAQEAGAAAQPQRLHIIGASVSGGFRDGPLTGATETGDSVTMQHVLKAWCDEHARTSTHNTTQMTQMFLDPLGIGENQVATAKKQKPNVVIAIDFLFWFAYGPFDGSTDAVVAAARKQRLQVGLKLLASLERPVLIGDLPDMRHAPGRVMRPSWVPSRPLLAELNTEIATFVKAHPNLRVVPLAELVRTLHEQGVPLPLTDGPLQTQPGALLQGDRLHVNRLGMAFLGLRMQDTLRALFPADHPLHKQKWSLEQFVEACGAEGDLEGVRAAAKEAGGAAKQGAGK
jgi:hypothetical protein